MRNRHSVGTGVGCTAKGEKSILRACPDYSREADGMVHRAAPRPDVALALGKQFDQLFEVWLDAIRGKQRDPASDHQRRRRTESRGHRNVAMEQHIHAAKVAVALRENTRGRLHVVAPVALLIPLDLTRDLELPFAISIGSNCPDGVIASRPKEHLEPPLQCHGKNREPVVVGVLANQIYPSRGLREADFSAASKQRFKMRYSDVRQQASLL